MCLKEIQQYSLKCLWGSVREEIKISACKYAHEHMNRREFQSNGLFVGGAGARRLSVMNCLLHAFVMSSAPSQQDARICHTTMWTTTFHSAQRSPSAEHNRLRRYQPLCSALGKCRWCRCCEGLTAVWLMLAQRPVAATAMDVLCVCVKNNGWLTWEDNPHGAENMKQKEKEIITPLIRSSNTVTSHISLKASLGRRVIHLTNISLSLILIYC